MHTHVHVHVYTCILCVGNALNQDNNLLMHLEILFTSSGDFYIVTFFSPDIHSLKQACERSPCPNISLSALSLPTHVLMKGLPQATPAFAIRLYMEKMGADVTDVNMLPSNEALVAFPSHSGK